MPSKKAFLSVVEIRANAEKTIAFKGLPFSYTEYSCEFHTRRSALHKAGATKDQLELFDRLVEGTPIKGGYFNPYAGDWLVADMKTEIKTLLQKLIFRTIQEVNPDFPVERITVRSPKNGRTRRFLAHRMPYPFDGWYYRTSTARFYVPLRYEKKIKGALFHPAEHEEALLGSTVFLSELTALPA